MFYCILLISTYLFVTLFGWFGHWIFHQLWSGRFYRAHMNHHQIQYPPSDLISKVYRHAGKDSTSILFIIIFSPIIITPIILNLFGCISAWSLITILVGLVLSGFIHNYFHDQFHIEDSSWCKFEFFQKLRKLHFKHHFDMSKNYGIVTLFWDKQFKTFSTM